MGSGGVDFDELILDHVAPLAEQTERLRAHLLEVGWLNGCILTVGWEPAHDPSGEFVVTLKQDPRGRVGRMFDQYEHPVPKEPELKFIAQDRCRSIVDLKGIVVRFKKLAESQPDPS